MKTLHTMPDGSRLLLMSRDEWDGLATATDIAFEDEDSVPEPLQEIARHLWNTFHRVATDVARPRPEQVDRYTGLRRAVRAVIDAAHDFRTNAWLSSVPTDTLRRLADALEAAPSYTEPLAPTQPIVGVDHPVAGIPRVPQNAVISEAERYRKIQAASDALIVRLPESIGNWHRDGDTMSGAIFWHRPDVSAVVYATPSWEGLPGTPVAVLVDGSTDQIDKPSLEVDALDYVGKEEAGADAYVRAISPVLDAVFEEYATRKSGKPAFRITLDGDLSVPFYAFPEAGSFFGVAADGGKDTLYSLPMLSDGTHDDLADATEVTNMSEQGDRQLLAAVNSFFGTTFTPEQFPGR